MLRKVSKVIKALTSAESMKQILEATYVDEMSNYLRNLPDPEIGFILFIHV